MSLGTKEQLEMWLKTIDVDCDKVLDAGSNKKNIKDRTRSFNVKELVGLDLEIPHNGEKTDIVCDLNVGMGESNVITYLNYFDVAFCLEVSEYLWNIVQALENINLLLKKGGILYFSTHFIYPVHKPEGQDFIRLTKWGVEKLMEKAGFKIEELKPRTTEDGEMLMDFFSKNKMRAMSGYKAHNEIGCLVKATKI